MLERLFHNVDRVPGQKTYILAGLAAALFFGKMVGLVPVELYDTLLPWIIGAMGPTVAMKLMR